MKLNEREKTELIKVLKKEYYRAKEILEDEDVYWLGDKRAKENFVRYIGELKEKYEYFENQEEVEIDTSNVDFCGNGGWSSFLWLIALAGILGFEDNNILPDDDTVN